MSARFPPNSNDFRLPSLKDLNFSYCPAPSTVPAVPDDSPALPKRSRPAPRDLHTPHPYPPQYAPYSQQQQPAYHLLPPAAQPAPPPPPHDQVHPHSVPVSHPAYPPYQSQYISSRPPPSVHPHHPQQQPPHVNNPYPSPGPPPSAPPPPQGPWNSPHHQPTPHRHHQPPPPTLPPSHIAPHALAHHPPPPQAAPLPPASQVPQQQQAFSRSTAIVPTTNIDAYDAYEPDDLDSMPSLRDGLMVEVVKHCSTLHSFAKNYAQFQATVPHAQPSASDLSEMSRLAVQVVHMLEEWKRNNVTEAELDNANNFVTTDDSRPPKRPWEDVSRDGAQDGSDANAEYNAATDKTQSTAEQDMELIRTKRATSTAGGNGTAGQPKSKYRKRSRATPPGKCHSCNIRETPEWRRGPDGARTLCNACGLHYAKLMRKKEKSGSGSSEQISLEDLRASARSGDLEKSRSKGPRAQPPNESSSLEGAKQTSQQQPPQPPPPQQHHQGSFQIMNLAPDPNASSAATVEANHQQQQAVASNNTGPLTHVWPAPAPPTSITHPAHSSTSAGRYAPDQFQHQSFMRSSQHVVIPQPSPR